ncbi:MAG: putative zinc-finger [Acidobacteriota bacterium]|nr:putative zinc-finger [Acidobacteriota bacterium]
MKCVECLPLIEEYIDGELNERMCERIEAHLSTCAECESEAAELRREQEIYALYQRDVEVTPAQWNIVRARIEQERDAQPDEPRARLRGRLGGLFAPGKVFRPALVAALVLIVIGITAGIIYLNSHGRPSELASEPTKQKEMKSPDGANQTSPPVNGNKNNEVIAGDETHRERNSIHQERAVAIKRAGALQQKKPTVLASLPHPENRRLQQTTPDEAARIEEAVADTGNVITGIGGSAPGGDFDFEVVRHAERAQLLLRSFRNVRLSASNRALDVSYEKEQSRKLLYRNIALKRDAAARGDQETAELLNTLEPILLDIAHLPDRAKARDVRSIEQRMEKKEIVAALQVHTLVASN